MLREYQRPQAALLGIAVIVLALLGAMPEVQRITAAAAELYSRSELSGSYFSVLCKALGIACLTRIGTDICRDCGEAAIGSAVELCGRICLASLALPLFLSLAETVLEVLP